MFDCVWLCLTVWLYSQTQSTQSDTVIKHRPQTYNPVIPSTVTRHSHQTQSNTVTRHSHQPQPSTMTPLARSSSKTPPKIIKNFAVREPFIQIQWIIKSTVLAGMEQSGNFRTWMCTRLKNTRRLPEPWASVCRTWYDERWSKFRADARGNSPRKSWRLVRERLKCNLIHYSSPK